MRNHMNSKKNAPVITIVRNDNTKNSTSVITFYDWLQEKYGYGYFEQRNANPATPQGFAFYARYTVEVLEDYIWEPQCNRISEWYEWLLPFFDDEKVLEQFVLLWHEYREEVPFA